MNFLKQNRYYIKEHLSGVRVANNYDIVNPDNPKELWAIVREVGVSPAAMALNFTSFNDARPFCLEVRGRDNFVFAKILRSASLFKSTVYVLNEFDEPVLKFIAGNYALKLTVKIYDMNDNFRGIMKLNPTGKSQFYFNEKEQLLGKIKDVYKNLFKDFFSTSDDYIVELNPHLPENSSRRLEIFAGAIISDMIFTESKGKKVSFLK